MRPVLVAWLVRHGFPAWFAPDYVMMVSIAAILSTILVLREAERDGARVEVQARAIMWAYVAALVGGYVFEWMRAIPIALAERSFAPILESGRAAYGGLVFGTLAPAIYLRRKKSSVLEFLDRTTLGLGITFALVRFGCFLEGCDYGRPTAGWLAVRFPAESLAARAHTLAGWVPAGAPSLPVHPTELYESAIGLVATLLALVPLRARPRSPAGAAFATWLCVYAAGRFTIELLRGDVERGRYAGLSTAQWVSVAIFAAVVLAIARRRVGGGARSVVAVSSAIALASFPHEARAQQPEQPAPLPPPPPAPTAESPAAAPPPAPTAAPSPTPVPRTAATPDEDTHEDEAAKALVTLRASAVSSLTLARPDIPSGFAGELDALYRLRLGKKTRLHLGLEGRLYENDEATHTSVGIVGELVYEVGTHFEVLVTLVPHHTWFDFKSDFYRNTNAYGLRYGVGFAIPLGRIVIGATPFAMTTTSAANIGVITQWEPRLSLGMSF